MQRQLIQGYAASITNFCIKFTLYFSLGYLITSELLYFQCVSFHIYRSLIVTLFASFFVCLRQRAEFADHICEYSNGFRANFLATVDSSLYLSGYTLEIADRNFKSLQHHVNVSIPRTFDTPQNRGVHELLTFTCL